VYGFAKQSGGTIRIESTLGEGTCVEIWLPRAPDMAGTAKEVSAVPYKAVAASTASLRILLVDDHAGVRITTAALLADLGHEVTEAGDGSEVIGHLSRDPAGYDLIISDYAMPIVSGTDVIERAREIRPDLPGIIITGYAEAQSISRRPDDVGVLTKPFTPVQLSQAIGCACPAMSEEAQ